RPIGRGCPTRCSPRSRTGSPTLSRRSTAWYWTSRPSRRAPSSGNESARLSPETEPGDGGDMSRKADGGADPPPGTRRIVHVSDCFPPRVGGIETQVHDLAVEQARRGADVHVLTATADPALPGGGRRAVTTTVDGVMVHRLASVVTFGLPFHPLEDLLLPPVLRALQPDVVHVHAGVVSPFAYAGARAARRAGLPLA